MATSSPVKSPVVSEAVAKIRTFRDSPRREDGGSAGGGASSPGSSGAATAGSPASRKLNLEGGVFAALKEGGGQGATDQLTQRYRPSGGSTYPKDDPAAATMYTAPGEIQPVNHAEAIIASSNLDIGLGPAEIVARVNDLKGQLSDLHR